MSFVISTSWNAFRHTDGLSLITEIKELGFGEIELSFNLTSRMVDSVERSVAGGSVKVASVHNFCPIPEGVRREEALPDFYSMSSRDPEQRRLAVKQAKISIDTAARLNARAVVLHCGRVEIPDRTVELIDMFNKGLRSSPEFSKLRGEIASEREHLRKPFLDSALMSLEELERYASLKGVDLGVETRYYHREIPFIDEIGIILDAFKGSRIFYWHDTGHAQLSENLGFVQSHEDFLKLYSDRLTGVHLHDIRGCSDHRPPGEGDMDFGRLKKYIPESAIKVVEAHRPATGEQLAKSVEFLKKIFYG